MLWIDHDGGTSFTLVQTPCHVSPYRRAQVALLDGEETAGFRFDQNTDPNNPMVIGALQNRRVSMREFTQGINEYMQTYNK